MAGVITINFKVIKGGMATLNMKSPIYVPGPVEPHFGPGRHIYFEGFSVDEHGRQHYMDVTVAYRQTILRELNFSPLFSSDLFLYNAVSLSSRDTHARKDTLNTNHTHAILTHRLHRIPHTVRLLPLPDLPAPLVRPRAGPCGRNRRHPQRLHNAGPARRHFRL